MSRDRSIEKADSVRYYKKGYEELSSVKSALDYLLYSELTLSISNNVNVVEQGSTVNAVTLTYGLSKEALSASINQGVGVGVVNASAGTHTIALASQSITSNRTYTFTAADDRVTPTASTSVTFQWKRYWGISDLTALNNAQVLALGNGQLTNSLNATFNFDGLVDDYVFMCFPQSLGTPVFRVNGLIVVFEASQIASFTNSSGGVTVYNVYRSVNKLNGSVTVFSAAA